ncbi:hypothetical protein LINPERPRIM_LOCUS25143 [Linum perenne]
MTCVSSLVLTWPRVRMLSSQGMLQVESNLVQLARTSWRSLPSKLTRTLYRATWTATLLWRIL